MERNIILASGSPRRIELIKALFESCYVVTADVDERPLLQETPEALVMRLSLSKAQKVWNLTQADGARVVIGADTVVALDDEIMGKPADEADAYRMLKKLSGRVHQVLTGVAILWDDGEERFSSVSQVAFYPLREEEIRAYIASGEPFGKAGAYAIQLQGRLFVKGISGDYSNIVGFPIAEIYHRMSAAGLATGFPMRKL